MVKARSPLEAQHVLFSNTSLNPNKDAPYPYLCQDAFNHHVIDFSFYDDPFSDCRFDFTLLLEQWILISVPELLMLVVGNFKLLQIWKIRREGKEERKVLGKVNCMMVGKIVSCIFLLIYMRYELVVWFTAFQLERDLKRISLD